MGCFSVGIIGFAIGMWVLFNGGEGSWLSLVIWFATLFISVDFADKRKKKREEDRLILSNLEKNELQNRVRNKGFTPAQIFQDAMDLNKYIVFDEEQQMILFVSEDSIRPYRYGDILQSKVLEDGRDVLDTTRSGSTTGAIIGGALGGGIGAVIGGIAGEMDSKSRESISVKVVVNDISNPSFEIELLPRDIQEGEQYIYTVSDKYKNTYNLAQNLHDKISVLIHQAEELEIKEEQKNLKQNDSAKVHSIADEIRKLAQLKSEGLITEDEYQNHKNKLMV